MNGACSPRIAWAVRIARALAFAAVVIVAALLLRHQPGSSRPVVERHVRPSGPPAQDSLGPEPAWLLAHREGLNLSPRQVEELKKLQLSYTRVMAGLSRERSARQQELTRTLNAAQRRGGIARQQLDQELGRLADVNAAIADARRRFQNAAQGLLTVQQKNLLPCLAGRRSGHGSARRALRAE